MSTSDEIKNMITNDPFIYNLFNNDTKSDFSFGRPLNWIKIPTSFLSESGKDSSISLLSVYTYSGSECNQITNSINDPNDIVFSNEGHVAVNFTENVSQAQFFYPNPTVTQNTGGSTGDKPIGVSNTVAQKNANWGKSFFSDDKILFSQNLKWILYQLPGFYYTQSSDGSWKYTQNKTGKVVVPVYVLLYNTVHRKNFQDVYAKIVNLSASVNGSAGVDPFSTQSFLENANTSYNSTIKKYCNAFRIKKFLSPTTAKDLYHYADPACSLAIDPQMSKLSQALSFNLTDETWKYNFYPGGPSGYEKGIQELSGVATSSAYCGRGSGGGPSTFLREVAGVIQSNTTTDSFMQILANIYIIIKSGGEAGATVPLNWDADKPGDSLEGAVCPPKTFSYIDCSINVVGDQIVYSKNNVKPVCGAKRVSTMRKTPYPNNNNDNSNQITQTTKTTPATQTTQTTKTTPATQTTQTTKTTPVTQTTKTTPVTQTTKTTPATQTTQTTKTTPVTQTTKTTPATQTTQTTKTTPVTQTTKTTPATQTISTTTHSKSSSKLYIYIIIAVIVSIIIAAFLLF